MELNWVLVQFTFQFYGNSQQWLALLFCRYYGSTSGFLFTPADGADYSEI